MSQEQQSKIWDYFEINAIDESKADCLAPQCKDKLKRGGNDPCSYGTSGLINYLCAKHLDEYKTFTGICDIEKKRKAEEVMQPGKKHRVQTIEFLLEKKKKKNNIIEMIVTDAMPFSMINNVGFTCFLNELEPYYVIPSEVYLSGTLIPNLYSAKKSKFVILLEQAAYLSFTSDVWTSTNNLNAFISLTTHRIDSKWIRMSNVLMEKRGVLMQDNGASMKKAAELSGLDHLGCFTHTIQSVMDAIVTARAIVGHFRHSTQATQQLLRIQKSLTCKDGTPYPTHRLIQDVTTCWNYTFYMPERLTEQKKAIALYCQENYGVTN
ncbi:hypothetical protein ACJMK2_011663 [Sinanodonta woodiana]|uniref:Uncharacterized protein n=1 Tax=Sinanodonta woodiana TaxID=1069815 RepID=A0ABD3V8W4_SINWO